jgi:hypothetical protein
MWLTKLLSCSNLQNIATNKAFVVVTSHTKRLFYLEVSNSKLESLYDLVFEYFQWICQLHANMISSKKNFKLEAFLKRLSRNALIATIIRYDLWSIWAISNAFYGMLSHTTLTTLCLFYEDVKAWKWSRASLAWCVLEQGHQWMEATTYLHHELQHGWGNSHFRIHGLGLTHMLRLKDVHLIMIVLNMYTKTCRKSSQSFEQNIKINHNINRKLDQRLMLIDDSRK